MKITAAAVLLGVSRLVLADDVTVTATPQAPPWTANNACGLSVSTIFQNIGLFVVPLTPQAGANSSTGVACLGFNVSGTLMAVDNTNFDKVKGQDTTAFIACDSPVVATVTTPSGIIGSLMTVQPPLRAIILYPQGADNWCDIQSNSGAAFSYNSIYTMNNSQKAGLVLQALGDPNHQPVLSSITAINSTATDNKNQPNAGATSPAAMSALYAVTGIITLLFLIIIVTGTIRAHRNPERYGPRAAFGGRMAQSRAKGLARAVLDTIPIVKFNDSREPKPETAIELGNGAQSGTTPAVGVDAVQHTGVNHTEEAASPNGLKEDSKPTTSITAAAGEAHEESVGTVVSNSPNEDNPADFDPDNLGCSICTEDFTAGEDVRVLPCQHQFHPSCIDPWLTNVSGTCPLCRLDLRPEEQRLAEENGENGESLPPPLTEDGQAISFRTLRPMTMLGRSQPVLRRQEVMLASIRARQASIDAAAAAAAAAEGDGEGGTSRTGLSARLRERFHIRTRTQPAQEPNT